MSVLHRLRRPPVAARGLRKAAEQKCPRSPQSLRSHWLQTNCDACREVLDGRMAPSEVKVTFEDPAALRERLGLRRPTS